MKKVMLALAAAAALVCAGCEKKAEDIEGTRTPPADATAPAPDVVVPVEDAATTAPAV